MHHRLEQRFDPLFALRLCRRDVAESRQARPPLISYAPEPSLPGHLMRALMLAEFGREGPLPEIYAQSHRLKGVIGDPFMGIGTVLTEANRLGFNTMGCSSDPMACWMTRQALVELDIRAFDSCAARVIEQSERITAPLYRTSCGQCRRPAQAAYFLWITRGSCSHCGERNDLCPDPKIAQAGRYPHHVYACLGCGILNSFGTIPTPEQPLPCSACQQLISGNGNVVRGQVRCRACNKYFWLPEFAAVPRARLMAIAVNCGHCPDEPGRLSLKTPDAEDIERADEAEALLLTHASGLPLPEQGITRTPQTGSLHKRGYTAFSDLSNHRQALTLGLLLKAILSLPEKECVYALLVAFSDTVRFQNVLCRHNARTLKCSAPAPGKELLPGWMYRENHVLGIDNKTKGTFRQMIQAHRRAKIYGSAPFELMEAPVKQDSAKNAAMEIRRVSTSGEQVKTTLIKRWPYLGSHAQPGRRRKQTLLILGEAEKALPPDAVLDGVFTRLPRPGCGLSWDKLSEAWMQKPLADDFSIFRGDPDNPASRAAPPRHTVQDMERFTESISAVFKNVSAVLAPAAPFVFGYAHEEWTAFVPIAVALLEARLFCTAIFLAAERKAPKKHKDPNQCGAACMIFVCRSSHHQEGQHQNAFIPGHHLDRYIQQEFSAHLSIAQQAGLALSTADRKSIVGALLTQWTVQSLFRSHGELASKPFTERVQSVRRRMDQGHRSISFQGMLE